MAQQIFPTKGNLINTKKSLSLAKLGYELLDRKRNILIRELMQLLDTAKEIRGTIEDTYKQAYAQLQLANITTGVVGNIAAGVPVEDGVRISYRSVMGVELPKIYLDDIKPELTYGFINTNSQLDNAYICFARAKRLTVTLAEVENSIYRLTNAIKKTQTRANALKNIVIPRFEEAVKFITNSLEEKEREEFARMKVIKVKKLKDSAKAKRGSVSGNDFDADVG